MKKDLKNLVASLTIVAVVAIIAMMICSLAALGYNSKITMDKEKIEVNTSNSDSNLSNTEERT